MVTSSVVPINYLTTNYKVLTKIKWKRVHVTLDNWESGAAFLGRWDIIGSGTRHRNTHTIDPRSRIKNPVSVSSCRWPFYNSPNWINYLDEVFVIGLSRYHSEGGLRKDNLEINILLLPVRNWEKLFLRKSLFPRRKKQILRHLRQIIRRTFEHKVHFAL